MGSSRRSLLYIIIASSGKMVDYCSGDSHDQETLKKILDKYHSQTGKRLWEPKHPSIYENLANEVVDRVKKDIDGMQIELRHLNGEDITSLNHLDLMALEEALENGLSSVRERESKFANEAIENGIARIRAQEDESKRLAYLDKMTKTEKNLRDMNQQYPDSLCLACPA